MWTRLIGSIRKKYLSTDCLNHQNFNFQKNRWVHYIYNSIVKGLNIKISWIICIIKELNLNINFVWLTFFFYIYVIEIVLKYIVNLYDARQQSIRLLQPKSNARLDFRSLFSKTLKFIFILISIELKRCRTRVLIGLLSASWRWNPQEFWSRKKGISTWTPGKHGRRGRPMS